MVPISTHAARAPEAPAVVAGPAQLSYGELERRANQLAHVLRHLGVGPEVRVGLCVTRSLDLVVGQLAILKTGGAYVPLDPSYPAERLQFILEDCRAPVLLTQAALRDRLPPNEAQVVYLDQDWPQIAEAPISAPPLNVTGAHLAYVIYTSGSTGQPKGVEIAHDGLMNLAAWQCAEAGLSPEDRTTQVASQGFDATVLELWPTLLAGACLLIVPDELRAHPVQLRDWMVGQRISVSFLPTPLAEQVLVLPWPEDAALRVLWTGGDALRIYPPVGARFQLINQYGPTENTVVTTAAGIASAEYAGHAPPIGRPIPNVAVYVLDRMLQPVAVGVPGELYIGGVGLARGYLGRPDLTAERFIPNPFERLEIRDWRLSDTESPISNLQSLISSGTRLYRTGDLARWRSDGQLEFLGRLDHQVKLRGYRIELGEIETQLRRHPQVRDAAVLVHDDTCGEKRLIAYVVPSQEQRTKLVLPFDRLRNREVEGNKEPKSEKSDSQFTELRDYLKTRLPDYMIPATFVTLDGLPLTPNGKIDRRSLPAPDWGTAATNEGGTPRTALEASLALIWAEVLGLRQVGVDANFFELGGHSLLATRLVARLRERLRIELPLSTLFEAPTVALLARRITGAPGVGMLLAPPPNWRADRSCPLPLSFAQRRLWFLDQLDPGNPAYNIPAAVRLIGSLDPAALQSSIAAIVARHEALRTTFALHDGQPVQLIAPVPDLPIAAEDLRGAAESYHERRLLAEARRPFDLARGPLARVTLFQTTDDQHLLLICMHHIIADGWSISLFIRELVALYAATRASTPAGLPELTMQVADVADWQQHALGDELLDQHLEGSRARLNGAPTILALPADRSRPAIQTFSGALHRVAYPALLRDRLAELARHADATLFQTLLAVFATLLQRYSGQDDILIGTPSAGRTSTATERLLGCFVNTLVLRADLRGDPPFATLLERVRADALAAYAHQDLPFERLVEALQTQRDLSRSPLFQVLFAFQNDPLPAPVFADLRAEPIVIDTGTAKFELTLHLESGPDGLHGWFEYNTDLFEADTIARLAGHFGQLLAGLADDPRRRLSELPILTPAEQVRLAAWNHTQRDYPHDQCIHTLFAAQAARTPDAPALRCGDVTLTYAELDEHANRLAHHLRRRHVGPEVRVGVYMDRTADLVVALLAVLKAGGAYVPLDPAYPAQRLRQILDDARPLVVVTATERSGEQEKRSWGEAETMTVPLLPVSPSPPLPLFSGAVVDLVADWELIAQESTTNPASGAMAENLAYLIYTSGSTGRPKGVAICHRNAVARLAWSHAQYAPEQLAGVLAATSVCFDLSVFELFAPLTCGGTVILAAHALELPGLAAAGAVTLINTVPSAMAELLRLGTLPASVRTINLAGEPLPRPLADQIYEQTAVEQVYNLYGPSEDTTYSTGALIARGSAGAPPIGQPLPNTRAYVLDRHMQPAPVGVPGELYLGGAGLARGYLGQPDLTAERFVPNPFAERERGGEEGHPPSSRLYKTGDLVRRRADGSLEYLGRLDGQVKLRGFRIELGEIEEVLRRHGAVAACAALVREDTPGDRRLVAYVVPTTDSGDKVTKRQGDKVTEAAQEVTLSPLHPVTLSGPSVVGELRAFLKERLPDYMVPSLVVALETLPLTPNGKVDRKALPAPGADAHASAAGYVAPRTAVERQLADIWCRTLRRERVGIHDGFFDLGGHSLLATQVITHMRATFGLDLAVRSIFVAPTIAELAAMIEALQWAAHRADLARRDSSEDREQGLL